MTTICKKQYPRFITMRIVDSACPGGYDPLSALLVNGNTAMTIVNGELEICTVQVTEDENVYDLVECFYPAVYAGKDEEFAFRDLLQMTVAEFFGKYPCYGEFVKSAKEYHRIAIQEKEQVHPYFVGPKNEG